MSLYNPHTTSFCKRQAAAGDLPIGSWASFSKHVSQFSARLFLPFLLIAAKIKPCLLCLPLRNKANGLPKRQETIPLHLRARHQGPPKPFQKECKNARPAPGVCCRVLIPTSLKHIGFYKGKEKHVYMKVKCLKIQISVTYKKGFKVRIRSRLAWRRADGMSAPETASIFWD